MSESALGSRWAVLGQMRLGMPGFEITGQGAILAPGSPLSHMSAPGIDGAMRGASQAWAISAPALTVAATSPQEAGTVTGIRGG